MSEDKPYIIDDVLKNGPMDRATNELNAEFQNSFENGVSPRNLISGEFQNGSVLNEDSITGGLIQTANTGQRVALIGEDNSVSFKNSEKSIASVTPIFSTLSNSEGLIIGSRFEATDFGDTTLVGWWAHDQPDPPENSLDSSENNLDLTTAGTALRRTPKNSLSDYYGYAKALDLNGTTQYLSRVDGTLLSFTSSFSFATWVLFDTLPANGVHQVLLSKYQASTNNRSYLFSLYNNAGVYELRLSLSTDGTAVETDVVTWTPSTATWYFVGFSYNAVTGTIKFIVNGVQQGDNQVTAVTSIYDSTASFALGATEVDGTPSGFLDGAMDETCIFSGALLPATFESLYNSGDGKTYSHAKGYYHNGLILETRRSTSSNKFLNNIEIFSKFPAGGINPENGQSDGISTAGGNISISQDIDVSDLDLAGMFISLVRTYFSSTLLPDNDTTRNLGSANLSWNNIYSNNVLNVSDERKKNSIREFSGGLAKIKQLQTKIFKRNGREPEDDKDEIGFMAQQVLEVFPEAVEVIDRKNKRGELIETTYAINQTMIINTAISAIQELTARLEALEKK